MTALASVRSNNLDEGTTVRSFSEAFAGEDLRGAFVDSGDAGRSLLCVREVQVVLALAARRECPERGSQRAVVVESVLQLGDEFECWQRARSARPDCSTSMASAR